VASDTVSQRVRAAQLPVTIVARREVTSAIARARVYAHISDGARFPSFAVAAMAAGVPTVARATEINREILSGAAALVFDEDDPLSTIDALLEDEARRQIAVDAGLVRAADFSPWTVASAYATLYAEVVRSAR
jgi:glycosyltransferase involved in cell wall biosynthesis